MKFCPKCKLLKNKEEFGKLKSSKDSFSYWCKKCLREKMNSWIANNREKVNRNAAKYRRTEKGKATKKRYYNSEKGQQAYRRYNYKRTNQTQARRAVNHAVQDGKLQKVNTQTCIMNTKDCEGRMEYHHYKGYDKKFWLDVIPLCRKHHCIIEGINYHN